MEKITQQNLAQFAPTYEADYVARVEDYAQRIGVESDPVDRDYGWGVFNWNQDSSIGFTWEEMNVVNLVYTAAQHNHRYDNDPYMNHEHGGNTAEHPVFIGAALDACRSSAGFGPENFDSSSAEHLQAAQILQRAHGMIAVHDFGELVDVAYAEMNATGASRKEPDEEELVVPFQLKMAAYALSVGEPKIYLDAIAELKTKAREAKQHFYEEAMAGNITGDEFIDKFGEALGDLIRGAEGQIREDAISPAYREAIESLEELNLASERAEGIAGALFSLTDRSEGNLHYARYAGRGAREYGEATEEQDPQQRMLNRLFGAGGSISYNLAPSKLVMDQIVFGQKNVLAAFETLAELKENPQATEEEIAVADKLIRAAAAQQMRTKIELLQKAPPFVDLTEAAGDEPKVSPTADADEQVASFEARVNAQRAIKGGAIDAIKTRGGVVDRIEGVMDTKALIAICEKAAVAIENGYTPPSNAAKLVLPLGEELPEELRVNRQDIKEALQKYPMEAANDYRRDQFQGEAVRI